MNNFFSLLLLFSMVLCAQKNYWSLGVSIKEPSNKKIVQREVDLNNFILDSPTSFSREEPPRNIYTLKTNYFIAPKPMGSENPSYKNNNIKKAKITDLILEEEYFEAAKKIIYLENNNSILEEFRNWDDFYYWSSFVSFNLGNHDDAYHKISQIANKENSPETLFLEALITKDRGNSEESNIILKYIIKEFSNNDYSGYARDILNEK